jgi:NAD(P)-dependent dehydrogenase (short-subunit alcohol dehydrogenase family)
MTGTLVDTALDRSVIAGYTRVGYRIRSAGWRAEDMARMDGKVVLVTGASSGLGLAASEGFARLGAGVRLLARDRERVERARALTSERAGSDDVQALTCDLSDLSAIRRFAADFAARGGRLDVLVNNAGVLTRERALSVDGVELTFATNVLGPFLLTSLLSGLLGEGTPGRIVNVSSGGMYTQRLHARDLQMADERFDGARAYARSKRADVILSELWAERLKDSGVCVHAMHPGWVDTPGLRASLPRFYARTKRLLRSPREGADTIVWLGASPEGGESSGGFWQDRRERPTHLLPWTVETADERALLWAECERLSGAGA